MIQDLLREIVGERWVERIDLGDRPLLQQGVPPPPAAVLDVGGNLVVLKRQDGSGNLRADIAIGKAWGALGMGISSRTIRDRLKERPAFQSALAAASDKLTTDFGRWQTPWGDINRYQRLTSDIVQKFDDTAPSVPVPFTSARWGSLASFGARTYPGTKKMYGTSGNSFVAVVEFGDQVRAKAVTAGGQSGNPSSPHFGDQALRYSTGDLRDVYFYRPQLEGHIERQYRPGQ